MPDQQAAQRADEDEGTQWLDACVLDVIAHDGDVDARALLFLLRRYRLTLDDHLGDVVGRALAAALDSHQREPSTIDRADWLTLFVEASAISDDDRLRGAIADLVGALRAAWRSSSIGEATASIGSCLYAASLGHATSVAAEAVDELERVVGGAYRPGAGVGAPADEVRAALALLIAYSVSGRLPYAMLAEELIHRYRSQAAADFVTSCEAARVLCRLAALHDDRNYRAAAVIVPDVDYRRDAERLLSPLAAEARRRGAAAAIYGLARLELESNPLDREP